MRNYSSLLAWILGAIVSIIALVNLGLRMQTLLANSSLIQMASIVLWSIMPIVFALVGALITSRQPRNRIGWLLMVPALLLSLSAPVDAYMGRFTTAPAPTLPILLMTWFQSWSWTLLIFPLFLILLLFPTGRPPSHRWRWILFYALGLLVFFILLATFGKNISEINDTWKLPNPIGFIPDDLAIFNSIIAVWVMNLGLLTLLCGVSLFVRYRHATATEREQIKWLGYTGGIFVIFYVPGVLWQGNRSDLVGDIVNLFLALFCTLFPIAIAIAILRYRLWDIDVIIRKTLVYSILTASLALVFFGSVVLLQWVFGRIAGIQESPVVVVLSTLAIAALFTPLRRRIQDFIDRRFFRKNYNAQKILEQFAAATRYEVEIEQLAAQLLSAVEETVQPESAGLWLKTDSNKT